MVNFVERDDEALPELDADDPLFTLHLPIEVVRKGAAFIPPPELPHYVHFGSVFEIRDVKFNDSGNIWFYLKDEKLRLKRNRLQERLQAHYETCRGLNMDRLNAVPGQLCAVLDNNISWRRGEIESSLCKDGFVEVRLIDVGYTKEFHVHQIRFLVKQFIEEGPHIFYGSLVTDAVKPLRRNIFVGVLTANHTNGFVQFKYFEKYSDKRRKSEVFADLSDAQKRFNICEQENFHRPANQRLIVDA